MSPQTADPFTLTLTDDIYMYIYQKVEKKKKARTHTVKIGGIKQKQNISGKVHGYKYLRNLW